MAREGLNFLVRVNLYNNVRGMHASCSLNQGRNDFILLFMGGKLELLFVISERRRKDADVMLTY